MSTQSIIYSAAANYNGAWSGYGSASGYAGNNSTNNYATAIRFQTPAFTGISERLRVTLPVIRGYTNSDATLYAAITTTDPTGTSAYAQNTPGADSGRIYLAEHYLSGLTASVQRIEIALPTDALRPSTTYYLVLSADRPARGSNNFVQIYDPSTISGAVDYLENASTISANVSTQEMGKSFAFAINRESASYTHTLLCRYNGTGAYTTIAENVGISYSWAVPLALAASIPSSESGVWEIRCETYLSGRLIGANSINVTLIVPSSVVPSISGFALQAVNENQTVAGWGILLQGYSKLRFTLAAAAQYSTIASWSINYGDGSIAAQPGTGQISIDQTTGLLTATGELTATATVTDARGRRATAALSYTVVPYAPPSASGLQVYRSTATGTASDSGTYIAAKGTAVWSSAGGNNSLQAFTAAYKERGAQSYSPAVNISSTVTVMGGALEIKKSYTVKITVQDALGTTEIIQLVATQQTTLNAKMGGLGAAFGKYAETDYALELAEGWSLILGDTQGNTEALDYQTLKNLKGNALLAEKHELASKSQYYAFSLAAAAVWLAITCCPSNSTRSGSSAWIIARNAACVALGGTGSMTMITDYSDGIICKAPEDNTVLWLIPLT